MAKPAWYFVEATSPWGDLYNLLHLPYTGMLLSFVVIGAMMAPVIHPDRLAASLVAYFLGLGIGAHCFDQLSRTGSHYVRFLTDRQLRALGLSTLLMAAGIGGYFAVTITPILWILIAVGIFFTLAYTVPDKMGIRRFHSDFWFGVSWGGMPFFTSYYVNGLAVRFEAVVMFLALYTVAEIEITLSRWSRDRRKEAADPAYADLASGIDELLAKPEKALQLLVYLTYLLAGVFVLGRTVGI